MYVVGTEAERRDPREMEAMIVVPIAIRLFV